MEFLYEEIDVGALNVEEALYDMHSSHSFRPLYENFSDPCRKTDSK